MLAGWGRRTYFRFSALHDILDRCLRLLSAVGVTAWCPRHEVLCASCWPVHGGLQGQLTGEEGAHDVWWI